MTEVHLITVTGMNGMRFICLCEGVLCGW